MRSGLQWVIFGAIGWTLAHAQCYDLGSSLVYQPQGRFIERWKDSDFHVDNADWGDVMQFALFSGVVRKTPSGWNSYRASRRIKYLCEPGVQSNGGWKCFGQPYYPATAAATIVRYPRVGLETWSLNQGGLFRYQHTEKGAQAPAGDHEMLVEATLDLNTGKYDVQMQIHAVGAHLHLKKDGIELWREQPFHAVVRLREVPCAVRTEKITLHSGEATAAETRIPAPPPCVVRVKELSWPATAAIPTKWEFIANPAKASTYAGCVLVFDASPPIKDVHEGVLQ